MTKKIKILGVIGARPNFMKISPIIRASRKFKDIELKIVHTKQHGSNISDTLFKSLGIGKPHHTLENSWETTTSMIAQIMIQLEKIAMREKPDLMLVVGDVTSTLAAALTANKIGIKLAHVEAGLRSFDRAMPEEINRIITDELSDLLFATEESAILNLKSATGKIHMVGNVMIDNLINSLKKIDRSKIVRSNKLVERKYIVFTAHRPSNVDTAEKLLELIEGMKEIINTAKMELVFPVHPRTESNLKKFGLYEEMVSAQGIKIIEPLDYIDFMKLTKESAFVITDSGGIQEETAYLKIPTITIRDTTERPSTLDCKTNYLLHPITKEKISDALKWIREFKKENVKEIALSDGLASQRIIDIIRKEFNKKT